MNPKKLQRNGKPVDNKYLIKEKKRGPNFKLGHLVETADQGYFSSEMIQQIELCYMIQFYPITIFTYLREKAKRF